MDALSQTVVTRPSHSKPQGDSHNMYHHILSFGTAATVSITYGLLSLAEATEVISALPAIEKLGGTGIAGLIAYFVINRLLKEKDKSEERIKELLDEQRRMHEQRLEEQRQHFAELIQVIREK